MVPGPARPLPFRSGASAADGTSREPAPCRPARLPPSFSSAIPPEQHIANPYGACHTTAGGQRRRLCLIDRRGHKRILIYSHDTFGLGHLRRCRAIAHSLVENFKQLSVLILSGSPIIGSFDFRARVDFVRVPGVIKLRNGEYTPLNLHLDIREMMSMRASIIQHTAEAFEPDML